MTVLNEDEKSLIWLKVKAGRAFVTVEVDFGYYLKKRQDSVDMQSLYVRMFSDEDNSLSLRYRMDNGNDPIEFIKWFANEITSFCDMVKVWEECEE